MAFKPRRSEKLIGTVTYDEQRSQAYKLLMEKGREALDNPHGMIGRACGCNSCFCCAAAETVKNYDTRARS